MKNTIIKKVLYVTLTLVLFLILSYAFVPQVLQGEVVDQGDIRGFRGMSREADLWNSTHKDEPATWTNSMFGGMPTIMITGNHKGDYTQPLFKFLQTGARPASYLFISLLGSLLLCLAFGVNLFVAIIGAIAISFCSYNMQIIQVGHNSKMLALAFVPWVLASCTYAYRQVTKRLSGETVLQDIKQVLPQILLAATCFALTTSFELKANHIQISYYLAIIMFVYVLSLFVWLLRQKERKSYLARFFVVSVLLFVMGLIGIATNANNMLPTYEYSHHTMRGGSLLKSSDGQKKEGLDIDYATAWSYDWDELPNLFIANYNGGSSSASLPISSHTIQSYLQYGGDPASARSIAQSLPMYWGSQPFTAGPMYIGSISLFLFILAFCLYRGFEKWYLLLASIIAICLALGYHFMPFTAFCFKYLPLYNKFRTVSMALTILQFTVPLMAILGLDTILKAEYNRDYFKRKAIKAFFITIAILISSYLALQFFASFQAASDGGIPEFLRKALIQDRKDLLFKDTMIALLSVLLAFILVCVLQMNVMNHYRSKRKYIVLSILALLVFVNMAWIGKRYLNEKHFVKQELFEQNVALRNVDKQILQDKSLDYRVLDLTRNIFNESQTSFYHKSVGGYSPVKLQRYQDLIDYHLNREIKSFSSALQKQQLDMSDYQILNMLNTKYVVLSDNYAITNEHAFGNAWFVDDYIIANTAREEISLLEQAALDRQAVLSKEFLQYRLENKPVDSSQDTISLQSYSPNRLDYSFNLSQDRTAVFSEIYYPKDWKVLLDNKEELTMFRANWLLRAVNLPAGKHSLSFIFAPESYSLGTAISSYSSIFLYLCLFFALVIFAYTRTWKKEEAKLK